MTEQIHRLYEMDNELYDSLPEFFLEGMHLSAIYPLIHGERRLNEMKAIRWLEQNKDQVLSPGFFLELYKVLTDGTEALGKGFKEKQNNVQVAEDAYYITASVESTPSEVDRLCRKYRYLSDGDPKDFEDVFKFVLEFICIHPMPDGNGRMSVLLTEYLLEKMGLKCALLLPFDALQSGPYDRKLSYTIRCCSGVFYGQKPYNYARYIELMLEMLVRSYEILKDAVKEA